MPASLYEIDRTGSNGLDERTLQLAFELSMLGFGDHISSSAMSSTVVGNDQTHHDNLDSVGLTSHVGFSNSLAEDSRSKKSQNMTECVPVPSSEHVAEIVGRQGCKIKALRAKTNTYIKTPVRGEEPVFVVTGRKEDVAKAKREILSAAEHFSQIRASRKTNVGGILGGVIPPGPQANIPGQVTIQVRVPYRVVGLVVGPKGATIKRIQQQTYTYIVTPSRDKEPVFEVTGMPEDVEAARREIEAHIAMRTGAQCSLNGNLADLLIEDHTELLASLYKTGLGSLFNYLDPTGTSNSVTSDTMNMFPSTSLTSSTSSGAFSSSGSISSSSSSSNGRLGDLVSIWNSSLERDEGISESPGFETSSTAQSNIWSFPSSGNSTGITTRPSPAASASPTDSLASITGLTLSSKRECLVCGEKEVNSALVPCGHNLFCLDCATRLCDGADPVCPICSRTVCQAIRILS